MHQVSASIVLEVLFSNITSCAERWMLMRFTMQIGLLNKPSIGWARNMVSTVLTSFEVLPAAKARGIPVSSKMLGHGVYGSLGYADLRLNHKNQADKPSPRGASHPKSQ